MNRQPSNNFNPNAIIDGFKQMINSGYNQQQIEQMLLQNNPKMQAFANQMKNSGMSPEQFVMQLAKQNNIPPQIVQQIMQGMRNVLPH